MSDSGMKDRVLGLLGTPPDQPIQQAPGPPPSGAQHEALQVLTLAQRTAEEQVNGARHEAERIVAEARERAGQVVRDAQAHAERLQHEAEAALSEAHAAAAKVASDAQARTEQAQQDADEILSNARMRSDELVKIAQDRADELQHVAEQRYEEAVGSLAAKRQALQQQIEALEQFDREYRARLQAFLQHQLRALWVDEPRVTADDLERPDFSPEDAPAAEPLHNTGQSPDADEFGSADRGGEQFTGRATVDS